MPARKSRESSAISRSIPKACRMPSPSRPLMSPTAKALCLRSTAVQPTCRLFRAFWPMADLLDSHLPMPSKNCWVPKFKSPNAASCIPLPSCPSAGWSSAHSPGSRNADACGKTVSANSTPACSSSISLFWRFCSEDREQALKPARPGRAQPRRFRRGDGLANLLQQALPVGTERSLQHQPVRGVIAAKDRALEVKRRQEALHLDKQFVLIKRLPAGKAGAEALFAELKADDQCRQVFRLRGIRQPCRVFGVLLRLRRAAEAVE